MSKKLWSVSLMFIASHALAASGSTGMGNGGDVSCEDRFNTIRDDIASWINQGGATGLKLPTGVTLAKYNQEMLKFISDPTDVPDHPYKASVQCVSDKVLVDGAEKTCKNVIDSQTGATSITCNMARFAATSDSDQYVLVHHEYAGLSGFEVSDGAVSDYSISNQISGYLKNEVVKKLAVNPTRLPSCASGNCTELLGQFDQNQGKDIFGNFMSINDADVSNLANSTWTLIGWAGSISNYYWANGIINDGSVPVQLKFCTTNLVGYSLAVNFLNVNGAGSNSGAIGASLGEYGLQFSKFPDYTGKMTLNACRFISTDFTQMMCIVDDGEPYLRGAVFEYFVKQ